MKRYKSKEDKGGIKLIIIIVAITCSFIYGCLPGPIATFVSDVSNNKKLWGGYQLSGIYQLKLDMFLMNNGDYPTPNKLMLVAPRNATRNIYDLFSSSPNSVAEYLENKSEWKEVIAIVKKGTRLKCIRFLKYIAIGYGSSLYIHTKIMDGPFAGKVVEVGDLSISTFNKNLGLFLLSPNPKLLSFEGISS